FTGNPGTGKTTVVKLLGKIYQSMGLLSKGHVHSVEANDLISGYIRQTGKDTKKAIEKARGGILFIDEAYMLFKEGANNDFGPEAIAALITEMSDGKGDIAIMVAGYPKEMDSLLKSNPGLKSRFRNYFHFEDYTPDELIHIAEFAANKKGVKISKNAEKRLLKVLTEAFRKRDRTFGNARFAHALVDEAKMNLGIRLMKDPKLEDYSKAQLSTLKDVDIEDLGNAVANTKLHLDIDENLLKEALSALNELTGLATIKQEVRELVKLSRYYKENNRDILKAFSMHSVFTGNPGTGKTTVARIIAKIYKALGMLERGHLIDADGGDLVAGYIGQTSGKTKDLISKAMGGILFIDEAYAITEGTNTGFGQKAIAALIKEMEDHRSEFGLIVAGYTKNMQDFLESNPGLKSRFDQNFHFEDFSVDELWEIT
ncbi:MAG: AAA family ATPase, partial [Desulfobacterales bacterium]|nr:AAA family ATPase [Desulfobacterales bacterium]